MSGESRREWKTSERAQDSTKGWQVGAVLLVTLLLFTAFVWVTWKQLQGREGHLNPEGPSEPAALREPEINLVNTAPFPLDTRAYEETNAQQARLHGYGWVDRDAGVVRMPIEWGIERVVGGARRDGGSP
jgi:hypothetical protein